MDDIHENDMQFEAHKAEHKVTGERLVLDGFPAKVNQLNALVAKGGPFDNANFDAVADAVQLPSVESLVVGSCAQSDAVSVSSLHLHAYGIR